MINLAPLTSAAAPAFGALTFPLFKPLVETLDPQCRAIGATLQGKPVGLVLAKMQRSKGEAEILSLYVRPEIRKHGLGTRMLEEMERTLARSGILKVIANYTPAHADEAALTRVLAKREWKAPAPSMLIVSSTLDKAASVPWLNPPPLGPQYDLFLWEDLSETETDELWASQVKRGWIPEDLVPFGQEYDHRTSVGLRLNDQIVGWALTRMWDPETLFFASSFVRRDLQAAGTILPLYADVVRRMRTLGIPNGLWTVPLQHEHMATFARRRMAPFATSFGETMGTSKWIRA